MFEKIKRFFELKLYSKKQIYDLAEKGVLTAAQAAEICGVREGEPS